VTLVSSHELFLAARLSLDLGYEEQGLRLLEHLLGQLPTHVAARCLLGHRYVILERLAEASEHFDYALSVDPLHRSALKGMSQAERMDGVPALESEFLGRLAAVYPYDAETRELLGRPTGGLSTLSVGRILSLCGRHREAVACYQAACAEGPEAGVQEDLLKLLLAQALWAVGQTEEACPILEHLVQGQPSWVRPKLLLGDIALDGREDTRGVALLHDARGLDSSGEVARDVLGAKGPYSSLLEQGFQVPAPPEDTLQATPEILACILTGEHAAAPLAGSSPMALAMDGYWERQPTQQVVKSADSATEARVEGSGTPVAINSEPATADLPEGERAPGVRIAISNRGRIIARYGEEGYREIDARLSELCEATARSTGDESIKLYVDDGSCLSEFGVGAVEARDACVVTALLRRIESRLGSESKKVKSLLIVGGDQIIPFHRLDNPADDDDPEVLSDWPYAAAEDEPLLARFAVGRLPDNEPANLETFIGVLEQVIAHHNAAAAAGDGVSLSSWRNPIRRLISARSQAHSSVGYTAEIWAEASRSVFELIGDVRKLSVSPPVTDYDFLTTYEEIPTLGYFNLHGFRGSPYWYGHGESEHGSALLPVALTPLSVSGASARGTVVYSEACYGADLEREYPDGSIPFNFLVSGALGFVGSTSMSYGALEPPLCGADLLGAHLWEGVLGGLPLGDALRRARVAFVKAAAAQQGYLDGEDQKALQSFVLYGDPSLSLRSVAKATGMDLDMDVTCPPLACCSRMMDAEALPLPKEAREKVKRSLPFLQTNGFVAHPLILCRVACSGGECGSQTCRGEPASEGGVSQLLQATQQRIVSKGGERLPHKVKVTINADGEILKVLVSRGGISLGEGDGPR